MTHSANDWAEWPVTLLFYLDISQGGILRREYQGDQSHDTVKICATIKEH